MKEEYYTEEEWELLKRKNRVSDECIKELIGGFGWTIVSTASREMAPKVMTTVYQIKKPTGEVKEYTAGEILGLAHDFGWPYIPTKLEPVKPK